ncbi:MAG: TerB family tellurite resistance protein [SAR324 cluster bacterium]|nr:TerB family tellurite resistance protein [SAR324 cluster bacterium]
MIDKLKGLLAGGSKPEEKARPDLKVATAAILLEVAESDQDFAPEEHAVIVSMLGERFDLDPGEVNALIEEAQRQRAGHPDLWPFTHAIGQVYRPDEKLELLVMVWRVIFADGRLDPYEDQLAHRLERMLSINHSLLMEGKRLAREAVASQE